MNQRTELITDLTDKFFDAAIKRGVPSDAAKLLSLDLVDIFQRDFGGSAPYIPKDTSFKSRQRDEEIFAKFNGDNFKELAFEYHLSEMRIRQIIWRIARNRKNPIKKGAQ